MKRILLIISLAIFVSSCSNLISRARTEIIDEPLECEGFALVSTYWTYEVRAIRLLNNPGLEEHQKLALNNARQTARPFVQSTAEAAVALTEYVESDHVDSVQRAILERNLEFWIHHFRPHVKVLVNTVQGTNFQMDFK